MRISTRIKLNILKLKHRHLMLKIKRPNAHKFLAMTIVIVFAGTSAVGYKAISAQNTTVPYLKQYENLEIQIYSLNGEVEYIAGENMTIKVGEVQTRGEENFISFESNNVSAIPTAQILEVSVAAPEFPIESSLEKIKVSDQITIYTTSDPSKSKAFKAMKIEIIK